MERILTKSPSRDQQIVMALILRGEIEFRMSDEAEQEAVLLAMEVRGNA